ncbi:hypothetical protein PPERSA_04732 [Pseudocohnilembus persalinus]|uniref:Uncharacterized protein n=1 Tax=Pseudocohnilembus persalinus TaxID=266149 RepID=A0A0V0R4L3_PSEPJ|nr:hypothetical protein PPERSA_04732 [Pseudocohnilembus persalinus]|eukprot:KRX09426.1 hypothetical protein PPERSA_04732 [Pseudocohnilembus persalinus]
MKETRRSMASQVFQSSNLFNQQKNEKNVQKQNASAVNKTFVENNKEQLKDDSKEDLQKNQDNKYMTGKMKQIFSNYTLEDCINLYTASSFCRFYITDQNFNFTNIPTKSQKNNNMMIKSSSEGTSNYRKNSDNQFLFDIKSNQRNLNLIVTNTNGECYDFDNIQVNQLADINVLPLVNIRNAGITGFDMFVQKNGDM